MQEVSNEIFCAVYQPAGEQWKIFNNHVGFLGYLSDDMLYITDFISIWPIDVLNALHDICERIKQAEAG